jgi:Predicted glycosylase
MGELLQRAANNPIITAADLPYRANAVFNPGAARVGEETVLLLRVEDPRDLARVGGAGQATTRESRPARRPGRDDQDEADAPDPRTQ